MIRLPHPSKMTSTEIVRELVARGQLTQTQIARKTGMAQSQISAVFNGKSELYESNYRSLCDLLTKVRKVTG